MRFADLKPGRLARIPDVGAVPGDRLPPAVEIDTSPAPCGDTSCGCMQLLTKDVDTGKVRPYHRPPGFQVIEITPAIEEGSR